MGGLISSVSYKLNYTTMKELFLRECSISGEGMNEGWIDEHNSMYFKYEKDVVKHIKEIIEEDDDIDRTNLSDDDVTEIGYNYYDIYWTEWED